MLAISPFVRPVPKRTFPNRALIRDCGIPLGVRLLAESP